MHHGRNADGADSRQLKAEFFLYVTPQCGEAALHAAANLIERIGPDPVDQAVFPLPVAGGDGNMILIDQNGFDARRAKLKAKDGFVKIHAVFLLFFPPEGGNI